MLPTPPAYVYRQEGPLRHFCASGQEALLTRVLRPSSLSSAEALLTRVQRPSSPPSAAAPLGPQWRGPSRRTVCTGRAGARSARDLLTLHSPHTRATYTAHRSQGDTILQHNGAQASVRMSGFGPRPRAATASTVATLQRHWRCCRTASSCATGRNQVARSARTAPAKQASTHAAQMHR